MKGEKVLSRITKGEEEKTGVMTGGIRMCRLEGCGGKTLAVRWEDGKLTYICGESLKWLKSRNAWRLL